MASWNKQSNFLQLWCLQKILLNFLSHFGIKAKFETILPFKILSRLLSNLDLFDTTLIFLRHFILRVWNNIVWSHATEEDHHSNQMCIRCAAINFEERFFQAQIHLQFRQIHFTSWTNTICNLDKYNLKFGQIQTDCRRITIQTKCA